VTDAEGQRRAARRARIRAVLEHLSARALSLFDKATAAGDAVGTDEIAVAMPGTPSASSFKVLPRYVDLPLRGHVECPDPVGEIAKEWHLVDPEVRQLTANQFTILDGLVHQHDASTNRAQERAAALARTTRFGALDEDPAVLRGLARR
jgi:hypothetical protein